MPGFIVGKCCHFMLSKNKLANFVVIGCQKMLSYVNMCLGNERFIDYRRIIMSNAQDNLLSKQQLAEYLQVSEMTIDRWRKKGLPWTRAGVKLVRFNLDEVNKWLEEQAGNGG